MQVTRVSVKKFYQLLENKAVFLARINSPEAFVVEKFYPKEEIIALRNETFEQGIISKSSWHPLFDGCPDYHRLHDNYPKAHVKAKMHAFYYHGWMEKNKKKFDYFSDVFKLKAELGGFDFKKYVHNIPSKKQIARVNIHHYPLGGGYQAEHIDPTSNFAIVQTIVQASEFGKDYTQGGVYARENPDSNKTYLDPNTEPGDLLVLSPGIVHGVDPIDPEQTYNWKKNSGRWMIMPIIINSDYPHKENSKPKTVTDHD